MDVAPVLVADGDNDFRSSVAELLERAGLTALTASTGEEAIDAARARRPSVIVLDVGAPGSVRVRDLPRAARVVWRVAPDPLRVCGANGAVRSSGGPAARR